MSGEPLATALARARLVVLDVDGTLTDGQIVLASAVLPSAALARAMTGPAGVATLLELKAFDVRDGIALRWLADAGLRVAWITGRESVLVRRRAEELGVELLRQGVQDKRAELARLQAELAIAPDQTVAMGDDLPDLGLAALAAVFVCPADACAEVRARAQLVTGARGGHGAVRELAEAILRARGGWDALVAAHAR